jgi:vacuolar-type H+-ATPase subunit H
MELVDQMRVTLPKEIKEAEELLVNREDLLGQSLVEARRIRASAESEFRSRMDKTEVVKEAQEQAAKIMEEGQQKAQRILDMADADSKTRRASADQYAQNVLYQLEQQIASILSTVRRGIDTLDVAQKAAAG